MRPTDFLASPDQLNQEVESGKASSGAPQVTRRAFIKRTGGATVAAALALHTVQTAEASYFSDVEFSHYFSCINDSEDPSPGITQTVASRYKFIRSSSHDLSEQKAIIGSQANFRLVFKLYGAASGPAIAGAGKDGTSRYIRIAPNLSGMSLKLQWDNGGIAGWSDVTPDSNNTENLEWFEGTYYNDNAEEVETILGIREDTGEIFFNKIGSPVIKSFSGVWHQSAQTIVVQGKYLVRTLVRETPSSSNWECTTFMGLTDFKATIDGVVQGVDVSLGLDSIGLGSSWTTEHITDPAFNNLLFRSYVLKHQNKTYAENAPSTGSMVEYAAPDN